MTRLIIINLIWILLVSCSGPAKKKTYNAKAVELNNRGLQFMRSANNDSALILFDKAIAIDKTYYLPHSNKALMYLNSREYDKALTESEKAIQANPDLAEGWAFAGTLHEKMGDSETAMKYYKKSIEIYDKRISDPEKKERIQANRVSRAFSLIMLGQEKEGKDELRKLKAERPNDIVIDELLKITKQEYMDQMFSN